MANVDYPLLLARAQNVFTPRAPVGKLELFQGRIAQIETLAHSLYEPGNHVILFGERGVGKTSLTNILQDLLQENSVSILCPRVNCTKSDTFATLWRNLFKEINVSVSHEPVGFSAVAETVTKRASEMLDEVVTPDSVRSLLAHLSDGIRIAPVFDEFDRVSDHKTREMMADTIKMLSDQGSTSTIILVGVADSVDELIAEHQSVERALVQILMPRMSQAEIKDIIKAGCQRLGMMATNEALQEIALFSQGLPHIAHTLGLHASKAALQKNSMVIDSVALKAGVNIALNQWQQSVKSGYYSATKSAQPGHLYREVILACALSQADEFGYFAAGDLREPLARITGKNYQIPSFARHLKELVEDKRGNLLQCVGEKRHQRYRFTSPLMRPFIIMKAFNEGLLDKENLHDRAVSQ